MKKFLIIFCAFYLFASQEPLSKKQKVQGEWLVLTNKLADIVQETATEMVDVNVMGIILEYLKPHQFEEIVSLKLPETIHSASWSPDSSKIVIGYLDNISVYNIESEKYYSKAYGKWNSVTYSPCGKYIAFGRVQPVPNNNFVKISILSSEDLLEVCNCNIDTCNFNKIFWCADDLILAMTSDRVYVFKFKIIPVICLNLINTCYNATYTMLTTLAFTSSQNVSLSKDGKLLAVNPQGLYHSNSRSEAEIYSLNLEKCESRLQKFFKNNHYNSISCASFADDNSKVVTGGWDNSIVIADLNSNSITKLQGHTDRVNSVSLSPDNKLLLSSSEDKSVRIWNASTGEVLQFIKDLEVPFDSYGTLRWSSDGHKFFIICSDIIKIFGKTLG